MEIFTLFMSSKKTRKTGSELRVSERLTFDAKITSTRIALLDDTAKFHTANYRRFTVCFCSLGRRLKINLAIILP